MIGARYKTEKPCEHCGKVKRVSMHDRGTTPGRMTWKSDDTAYLCRPCARELGYRT